VVVLKTSMGTIKVELFPDKAPITVKNFLQYVEDRHYDGTIFHRVIGRPAGKRDFMIQGGGFTPALNKATTEDDIKAAEKKTRGQIKNEARKAKVSNERGTIAMARTPRPDSATAQFFINVGDNKFLDPGPDPTDPDDAGYCAFGKVIEGMAVVDKIKAVPVKVLLRDPVTGRPVFADVPVTPVVIESARLAK
jgi:cyclophilin family peptidyl-prolyl cis-trans isomerase